MKRERSAVIIIDRAARQIVLIRRRRGERVYATLPGGKIEDGETPADAAVREAYEETSLKVKLEVEVVALENLGRVEHYFLAKSFAGELALGGPEKEHQTPDNAYDPQWAPVDCLDEVNLLPVAIRPICRALALA